MGEPFSAEWREAILTVTQSPKPTKTRLEIRSHPGKSTENSNNTLTESEDKVKNDISNFSHRQRASLAGRNWRGKHKSQGEKTNKAYEEAVCRKKEYKYTVSIFKDAQSYNERKDTGGCRRRWRLILTVAGSHYLAWKPPRRAGEPRSSASPEGGERPKVTRQPSLALALIDGALGWEHQPQRQL